MTIPDYFREEMERRAAGAPPQIPSSNPSVRAIRAVAATSLLIAGCSPQPVDPAHGIGVGTAAPPSALAEPVPAIFGSLSFNAGESPGSIAIADLNADGLEDLVVTNKPSNEISILLSLGHGNFEPARHFAVGNGPTALTIADLDGDGDKDLAVANSRSYNVSFLLNNGMGEFSSTERHSVGGPPVSITAADLDGNGSHDLVLGVSGSVHSCVILRNDGDATFGSPAEVGPRGSWTSIETSDIDGDGDVDLALAGTLILDNGARTGAVIGLMNDSTGVSFDGDEPYLTGDIPEHVAVADLDGDGDDDFAVAMYRNISVLLNTGETFFSPIDIPLEHDPRSLCFGDLNDDGKPDLAVATEGDHISVLLNDGHGSFDLIQTPSTGIGPNSAAIGDLDGDGALDLVATIRDTVSVILNDGHGNFDTSYKTSEYGDSVTTVVVAGDLDSDGDPDLVVADSRNEDISILLNNGHGAFNLSDRFDALMSPASLGKGDLNNDGYLDLVIAGSRGVILLLGRNKGSFGSARITNILNLSSVAVGDLDNDGDADLALAGGRVWVQLNRGDGTFGAPIEYRAEPDENDGTSANEVTAADLDNDGYLDLVVARHKSAVLINNGDATFAEPKAVGQEGSSRFLAIGDIDRDGDIDLAMKAQYTPVTLFHNDGAGTFNNGRDLGEYLASPEIFSAVMGDLDGDGGVDLITTGRSPHTPSVLLVNRQDGTFATSASLELGEYALSVALEDFDADGDIDLAATVGDGVRVMLNRSIP